MITQAALLHHRLLADTVKRLSAELETNRRVLLKRVAAGEEGVEFGVYDVQLSTRETRSFSYLAMVDLFGQVEADRIRDMLPLKSSTTVIVTGPPCGSSGKI